MRHQEDKTKIYSFIDGELSSTEERILYGQLSNSSALMTEYNLAKDIDSLLEETITYVEPPEGFADDVLNLIAGDKSANAESAAVNLAVPEADNSQKEHLRKKPFWKSWFSKAAGFALAVLLGTSMFASNGLQIAGLTDNDITRGQGKEVILQPDLTEDNDIQEVPGETSKNNEEKIVPSEKDERLQIAENSDGLAADEKAVNKNSTDEKDADSDDLLKAEETNQQTVLAYEKNVFPKDIVDKGQEQINDNKTVLSDDSKFVAMAQNFTNNITIERVFESFENVSKPVWLEETEVVFVSKSKDGYSWFKADFETGKDRKLVGPLEYSGIWSAAQKKVIFTAPDDNGVSCIWATDDNEITNITPADVELADGDINNGKWAFNPVVSVKGEIAYLTERFGDIDIMLVDSQGTTHRLTSSTEKEDYPVWSPDGEKIAYYRYWNDKKTGKRIGEVVVQNADGTGMKAVTPKVPVESMVPAWSPDGNLLAINVKGEISGIWQADITSDNWQQLRAEGAGQLISWSPTGQSIAFNDSNGKLSIIRRETARQQWQLLDVPVEGLSENIHLSWSPDGSEFVFEMTDSGTSQNGLLKGALPKNVSAY